MFLLATTLVSAFGFALPPPPTRSALVSPSLPSRARVALAAPPEVQCAFGLIMLLSVSHSLLPPFEASVRRSEATARRRDDRVDF